MGKQVVSEFQRCPEDCGAEIPGLALGDDRQLDYPERDTTIGQTNIEAVLADKPLENARVLHVGIGNSQLAERFSQVVKQIDGITMGRQEQRLAMRMNLSNYTVMVMNKYSGQLTQLTPGYDFIVDNNLFSYACCRRHFMVMMDNYRQLLKSGGELLTERRGLSWVYRKPDVLGMSFAELQSIADGLQFEAGHYANEVYFLRAVQGVSE